MSSQPSSPLSAANIEWLDSLESSTVSTNFPATKPILPEPYTAALDCVSRGWAVLPCEPNGKLPDNRLVSHGVNSATKDPEIIKKWFAAYPDINYAVAGGDESNLSFYDYDDLYADDTNVDYPESQFPGLHKSFRVRSGRILKPGQVGGFHLYAAGVCQSRALFADAALPLIKRPGVKKDGSPLLDKNGSPIMQTFDNHNRLVVNGRVTIGEVRSRGEYVIGYGSHHKSGRDYELVVDAELFPNPIQDVKAKPDAPAIGTDQQNKIAGNVEKAFGKAQIEYKARQAYQSGFKWLVTCPWEYEHTSGKNLAEGGSSSSVFMAGSGALGYRCLHAHCQSSRNWQQFREYMESIAGKLSFTAPEAVPPMVAESSQTEVNENIEPVRPMLSESAYYGLAGAIVKKLEPCTESHPAGLLLELMISFGNMLGRSAYIQVEDTKHFTNEFMVKVGESSRSRKGTGKNRIRAIMEQVDPEWLRKRNVSGIGSGEVIIHLVRDPHIEWFFDKKKGTSNQVVTDAGIDDKRLCVNLGEFQGILSVCHRPDNLLSVVMRDGWDGLPLHNLVKTNPASCAEGLLSLLADVTRADLTVSLSQADRANGFANRFLWAYVYRTKLLPEGGGDMDWTVEVPQLREAVEFGRHIGRVFMDKAARDRWCRTVYPKLEREIPGIVGALTARASAHTMRLALLYAILDKSEHIRLEHLEAAEGLWQYCEDSVQAIFGNLLSPEQSKILEFLAGVDSSTKKQLIHDCFKKNRKADLIDNDLQVLEKSKKITSKEVNGGRQYRLIRGS